MLSPAAPPPATMRQSRASRPWATVMSVSSPRISSDGDHEDGLRRASAVMPSGSATLGDRGARGAGVEHHPAAEEVVRVDVAEHERGVGDRRLGAARP